MHRPALVTAPASMPVSLAEAKGHLRVDINDEEDDLIEAFIKAATDHLDGWTGILGACLVEQEWRQDFDRFARCLSLPLGPVTAVESVTWRDSSGQTGTVGAAEYALQTDAAGQSYVRFKDEFSFPSNLAASAAVSVTFKAGYPTVNGASTVPAALRSAILLHVGHLYENREAATVGSAATLLPFAYDALITPYRKMRI